LEVVGNAVFSADATCKRFFVSDTTGNGNVYINGANGSQSLINLGGQTNYNIGAIIYDDASNFLAFRTNSVEAARFNSTGNLVLKGGTAAANGVGITFPATPVASSNANCLDDYEEGTFTPTISGSTVAGVGTYSNQIGRYTKIGNQVTVWIRISWSAHTGTGDMRISDLPFTIANVNNLGPSAAIGYSANITLTAGNYLMLFGNVGTTRIDFWQTPTGGGATGTVSMDSSADIGITMTYFV
jgi:hypothetical protein